MVMREEMGMSVKGNIKLKNPGTKENLHEIWDIMKEIPIIGIEKGKEV